MSAYRDDDTLPPFTLEEAKAIREQFMGPGDELTCPRCRAALTVGHPIAAPGRRTAAWQVRCDACKRRLVVRNVSK